MTAIQEQDRGGAAQVERPGRAYLSKQCSGYFTYFV